MISVIVPVYNVEPYLRKCLDSIVKQTYKDHEILIIDDGSTDGGGAICDEYAGMDNRIRTFHTENRGLSAARNLGLDEARGEWIGFVDSDDWIEPNFIETAMSCSKDADIVCCSHFEKTYYSGFDALIALINREINTFTWNKIYRKKCFAGVRFPEGRIMEDIATTYKLLHLSERVVCSDLKGYHHIFRENSLAQTHNMKNLFDYWQSTEEMFDYCTKVLDASKNVLSVDEMDKTRNNLLRLRAYAIARAWGWRTVNHPSDSPEWERLCHEARTRFPLSVRKSFPVRIRGGLFLARFDHPLSFWIANKIHVMTRRVPIRDKKTGVDGLYDI